MRTKTLITLVLLPVVNSVLFGTGAIILLSLPAMRQHMNYLLPAVVVASLVMTPVLAWYLAPRMQARYWYPLRHKIMRRRMMHPVKITWKH